MADVRSPSAVAKRHLFSRPNKVNRVYPDEAGVATVAAAATSTATASRTGPTAQQSRLLHASFESEESAYQSGGSSPACEAAAVEPAATRGGSAADLKTHKPEASTVTPVAPCSADKNQQQKPPALPDKQNRKGKPPNSGRLEAGSGGLNRKGSSLDLLGGCRIGAAFSAAAVVDAGGGGGGSRRQSRRYSVSGGPVRQEVTLATAGLDQSGDDFKERLKRLFGARPSIGGGGNLGSAGAGAAAVGNGSASGVGSSSSGVAGTGSQIECSSADLQRQQQSRSRRTSLAARLFSRLPFGRRDDGDTSDAEAGTAAAADEATRYCRLCGEANCELHGSLSDMGWARRQLAMLGCYRTREDHERSMLLENHTATRFVTAAAVVVFLAIVIALIALCVIAAQQGQSSAASQSATAATTTGAPGSDTTTP